MGGVLYETFEFECGLDGRYGAFGVEIRVGRQLSTTEFFGRAVSRSAEPESIKTSLDTIDRWCRAHLSPEFLAEYEANLAAESR
ncbi:hypothetical protein [Frondihabitans australicus]|uniref:Uncharacterized protein n=1 Tax=Frondihabitans australicus TaxID=386892 RepID=A0A495IH81_9MICO|nr:hypothetical protein [Frondihabitans australicus]RKR74681.1 hypothetical protein C8E83_1808 [Frondihabitans australicus]